MLTQEEKYTNAEDSLVCLCNQYYDYTDGQEIPEDDIINMYIVQLFLSDGNKVADLVIDPMFSFFFSKLVYYIKIKPPIANLEFGDYYYINTDMPDHCHLPKYTIVSILFPDPLSYKGYDVQSLNFRFHCAKDNCEYELPKECLKYFSKLSSNRRVCHENNEPFFEDFVIKNNLEDKADEEKVILWKFHNGI